jgi:hypothetical protein
MNIRITTLAGAALLALTVSAAAQETGSMTGSAPSAPPEQPAPQPQYTPPPPPPPPPPPAAEYIPGGWYVGAGAGWSGQNAIKWQDPFGNSGEFHAHNNPIVFGSIGYKLPDIPFRAEVEGGYTWHGLYGFDADGANFPSSGHANLSHVMVNGLYDFPIAPLWAITVGGGVGVGMADYLAETPVSGHRGPDIQRRAGCRSVCRIPISRRTDGRQHANRRRRAACPWSYRQCRCCRLPLVRQARSVRLVILPPAGSAGGIL